jgi:hypothetical protein
VVSWAESFEEMRFWSILMPGLITLLDTVQPAVTRKTLMLLSLDSARLSVGS